MNFHSPYFSARRERAVWMGANAGEIMEKVLERRARYCELGRRGKLCRERSGFISIQDSPLLLWDLRSFFGKSERGFVLVPVVVFPLITLMFTSCLP